MATGTVHRMADPRVRLRVAALLAALVALAWVAITLGGRTTGPFSSPELRDLSGVPVPPPQITDRFGPPGSSIDDLSGQLEELRRRVGETQVPPELLPSPESGR